MKFIEYQKLAFRTLNEEDSSDMNVINMFLGLAGETGESVDYFKKVYFHGHKFEKEKLISELGDVLWYLAGICSSLEIDLEEVAIENIKKLHKRYPNGFNQKNSIYRDEVKNENP
jgi:NTP pyrophosphatase (non-canonical NTP hydrolase)